MKPYYEDGTCVIYHGDCREIAPTLGPFDLICSDPPYGIKYVHGGHDDDRNATRFAGMPVVGDDVPFEPGWLLGLAPSAILWGANHYAPRLPSSGGWLIWDKRVGTVVNDHSDCELAWTNFLGSARIFYFVWDGFRRQGNEKKVARVHPTQKPVGLMQWCLGFAPDATLTLDPYMGSGTTLRAAKDLGRKAVGIEIEERYCEIAAKRLGQEVLPLTDLERTEEASA